jgi:O-antigen ligase
MAANGLSQLSLMPARTAAIVQTLHADMLLRSILLATTFLVTWISFRPFQDLADPPEVTGVGNIANQVGYSALFLILAVWTLAHQPYRLVLLVRPILVVTLFWLALSVATSWEPGLSARRLAYTLIVLALAAMALLLPKNIRHFADVLIGVVLFILLLCYFGVLFAPSLSIHQSGDFLEPELAGSWRGVFGHKNEASAVMVIFIFIGAFAARMRGVLIGGLIIVLALIFLFFTQSKTSIAMLPVVLIISWTMSRLRRPLLGLAIAVLGVLAFNILSVGSIYLEPIRRLLNLILTDATFTGRTEVWEFVLDHIRQRPITGYGFATFWGTSEVVYGMGGYEVWANAAGHAHNGYLDLAVTIGIPGGVLATFWLVLLPFADFYRSSHDQSTTLLRLLFLRVCLFAAYGSCFENFLLPEGGTAFFLFVATFGLRLLSVARATP